MRSPNNSLPAHVEVICGAMGSGKSQGVKNAIKRERDVFVFDVKNEYGTLPGFKVAHSRAELVEAAKRGGRWAFPSKPEDFDFWCRVVWARGSCMVIAEELASVTQPGKACGAWHLICTQGRGFGLRIVGITQRPAEIDKTIIGNASLFRCHRLSRANDRKYMAAELDCEVEHVARLNGFQYLERTVYPPALSHVDDRGRRVILRGNRPEGQKARAQRP
ncbi:MAG: hypothetical protein NVS9B2_27980 [Steroidobacteraceae bacterium]